MHTVTILGLLAARPSFAAESVWLDSLDISKISQEGRRPTEAHGIYDDLKIAGQMFERGFRAHGKSVLYVNVGGRAEVLRARVGLGNPPSTGYEAIFAVLGDGKTLWQSDHIHSGDKAAAFELKIAGIKELALTADCGTEVEVIWADPQISFNGPSPKTLWPPLLRGTLRPLGQNPEPRINGAAVVGNRPGTPFLFTIPAIGARPMTFKAKHLPPGLKLDTATGIISGEVTQPGEYAVLVTARNARGTAQRKLRILVGDQLALTPPMGWNSWNVIQGFISESLLLEMADAMVHSGLRDIGFQYVNLDDCWIGGRDAQGVIYPDRRRFPHGLKPVADYLHAKGLKLGLYSSPGPGTCCGYPGTLNHEERDARTYAAWGVDFLKHDFCSTPPKRKIELYGLMGKALARSGRSIVYSLGAQPDDHLWGTSVGGHMWRTAGDVRDAWSLPEYKAGIIDCFDMQGKLIGYQKPGAWNDPDLLVVGIYGQGASANDLGARGCNDTEYRSQMSLWSLRGAPLLATCDLRTARPSALEILGNAEVLDVDQDALGVPATRRMREGSTEIWARPMEDGSLAVGLLNRGEQQARIIARWEDLGLSGGQRVRDLWQRKDAGEFGDSYDAIVPPHGVVLLRMWRVPMPPP